MESTWLMAPSSAGSVTGAVIRHLPSWRASATLPFGLSISTRSSFPRIVAEDRLVSEGYRRGGDRFPQLLLDEQHRGVAFPLRVDALLVRRRPPKRSVRALRDASSPTPSVTAVGRSSPYSAGFFPASLTNSLIFAARSFSRSPVTASRSAGAVSGAVSCHSSGPFAATAARTWPAGLRTSTVLTSFRSNASSVRSRKSLAGFCTSRRRLSGTSTTAGLLASCA